MKKKLLQLVLIMCIITVAGIFVSTFTKKDSDMETMKEDGKITVVTTIYPVYLIGINLADGIDNIEVKSLINRSTGCLHDYQLTSGDMKVISSADIMVINGGGMEGFLQDITDNYPDVKIIDAGKGIDLLRNPEAQEENKEAHEDDPEFYGDNQEPFEDNPGTLEDNQEPLEDNPGTLEDNQEPFEDNSGTLGDNQEPLEDNLGTLEDNPGAYEKNADVGEEESGHNDEENNSHVWLDPVLYKKQIENVRDELINYVSTRADMENHIDEIVNKLNRNADSYMNQIQEIEDEVEKCKAEIKPETGNTKQQAVIFHEAFAYLANRLDIDIAFSIELGPDTSLSAGRVAEIVNAIKKDEIHYLFTEEQYSTSIPRQIAEETDAKVYVIDSVVTGDGSKDSYLKAMRGNLQVIKEASKNT